MTINYRRHFHNDLPYDPGQHNERHPTLDEMDGSENEEDLFMIDTDREEDES